MAAGTSALSSSEPTPAYADARRPAPLLVKEQATPAAAFEAAQRVYRSGARLDMQALASQLGVARTTLYRWTGGRERLLIDVIWSLSDDLIARVWQASPDRKGADRLLFTFRAYVTTIVRSRALQAFLRNETHTALRLLTTRGSLQDRLVDAVAGLLREEQARGTFQPRAEPLVLAYAIVRVMEGFLYNDAIVALEPQIDDAMEIVRLILE